MTRGKRSPTRIAFRHVIFYCRGWGEGVMSKSLPMHDAPYLIPHAPLLVCQDKNDGL
ncbi:MAG: hypothetical protein KME23_00705 [Goleter apudmare HA4340-LM2]|nr:hypothetical protein [Goleter apudmare HA4340-LM2]